MKIESLFDQLETGDLGSKRLLDGPGTLTYGDVAKRCRQLSIFLKAAGLQPGDRIGIASKDEWEVSGLILSCIRLGFPIVMMDPNAKPSEAQEIIRRTEIRAIFPDPEVRVKWSVSTPLEETVPFVWPIRKQKKLISRLLSRTEPGMSPAQSYPECMAGISAHAEELLPVPRPDAVALLLCTSGTTGSPKILQLNYTNVQAAAVTTSSKLAFDSSTRLLNLLPLTHYDGIISGLFTAFWNTGTQIRLGSFQVSMLPELLDAVYKYRATHLLLTPSVLALLMRLGEEVGEAFRTQDFRFVISVAAPLPPAVWEEFERTTGKKVINVYGLSETGNNLFAGPDEESYRIGSIGKPVDCAAMILNDSGEPAGAGETGELLLQGSSVTSGYLGESVPTKTANGSEWFATGDLAYMDESGVYWLVGRKKNIIIVGGRNVYPDEVNNALLSHPRIIEAATVGFPDEVWGERVISFIVAPGMSTEMAIDHAAQFLTDYKVPRDVHLVSDLPKGRSGKVLVKDLIARLQEGRVRKETSGERVEERILQMASESFRVPMSELSVRTTPQSCSRWDSVAHMDLVVSLEKEFGLELLPREVMQMTSLGAAVQLVQQKLIRG